MHPYQKILCLAILAILIVGVVDAKETFVNKKIDLTVGKYIGSRATVDVIDNNTMRYSTNKLSLHVTSKIEGAKSKIAEPAIFTYTYDGELVKETIELKEYRKLSFDLSIPANSEIVPYAGGYRIISSSDKYMMNDPVKGGIPAGIQILAPTAYDAYGNDVQVWYTLSGNTIILNIDDSKATYPLTIDPTMYLAAYTSYAKLRMHMNASVTSDEYGHSITNSGVALETTIKKYGAGSANIGGAGNSNYLQVTSDNADFAFGGNSFTIVMWVFSNAGQTDAGIYDSRPGSTQGKYPTLYFTTGNTLVYFTDSATRITGTVGTGAWHQVALIRNATNQSTTLYVDGVQSGDIYAGDTTNYINTDGPVIGNQQYDTASHGLNGYIDEVGVWNGVAIPIGELQQPYEFGTLLPSASATFSVNETGGTAPKYFLFTDTSSPKAETWKWNYTAYWDGVYLLGPTTFATTQNPTEALGVAGTNVEYRIFLNVTNVTYGGNDSVQVTWINTTALTSTITSNVTRGNAPVGVGFNDTTTGETSRRWDFGDGTTSTLEHPSHTYADAGNYSVVETVYDAYGGYANSSMRNITATFGEPIASFTQSITSGPPSTSVHFIDTSNLTNTPGGYTYLWDFGDSMGTNPTATTVGSVDHVYAYSGIFYPSLAITSTNGTGIFNGSAITLTNPVSAYPKEPISATIHVQTFFGAPIDSATVYVQGITTSTGSWDYVASLFGFALNEAPIQNTSMSDTTDTTGDAIMLMIPSTKYNVTVVKSGYSFPASIWAPTAEASRYTVVANLNATGWYGAGNDTLVDVNMTVSTATINSTHGFINITYADAMGTTTAGAITIYKDNSTAGGMKVAVASMPVSNSTTNSTVVTIPQGGTTYTIQASSTSGTHPVLRTFTAYFKGAPVTFFGLEPTILLWVSVFFIIFTAMFAGATHAPQMSIIICIEAWVFWIIGWLDPAVSLFALNDGGIIGTAGFVAMLAFATFVSIWWNFSVGRRKPP